jgi:hypothetical protein
MGKFASAPIGEYRRRRLSEAFPITCAFRSSGHFHPVAAGVKKIDRFAEAMISRPNDINPPLRQPAFTFIQSGFVSYLKCKMLHPIGGIGIPHWRWSIGKFEEGEVAAVTELKENVKVGTKLLRRWNPVLGDGMSEFEADNVGVKVHGLRSI